MNKFQRIGQKLYNVSVSAKTWMLCTHTRIRNRITTLLDDAGLVTRNGSRGITDISYDRFGNPLRISYADGSYTEHVYSSAGEKLKATHATSLNGTVTGKTTTEYRGNVIYRDGKVDMVLFPGGYATINGTAVTFHYYTQDYLGNNRAVINGLTGAVEQTTAYYPYGAVIADLGSPHGGQPYRFGGKELITANGLNEHGFGGQQYKKGGTWKCRLSASG